MRDSPRRAVRCGILLVEDDLALVPHIGRIVRAAGHHLRHAGTVAEARAQLAVRPPDLVLLDLGLPDGDGLDLLPELAAAPNGPAVVVVTGRAGESAVRALDLGARDVLGKPFRSFELRARLDAALRDRETMRQLERLRRRSAEAANRAIRLQRITAALSKARDPAAVARVVVRQGTATLGADGGLIALLADDGATLEVVGTTDRAKGARTRPRLAVAGPSADVLRTGKPLFVPPGPVEPSLAALPLKVRGQAIGVLIFRFADRRRVDPADRSFALSLADHCAQALDRARLYEKERAARAEAEAARAHLDVLAEAGVALTSSLEYAAALEAVTRLAIPVLADRCFVDLLESDGTLQCMAVSGSDAAGADLLREMRKRYPLDPTKPHPVLEALRTGRPRVVPRVSSATLRKLAHDEEHLGMLRRLAVRSSMCVPLQAHGRVLGVLSFARTTSSKPYGPADLALAEALARRCALTVDNARLYEAAQAEIAERARAEDALRESEARFRRLAENAPDVLLRYELRPSPRIAYVSPAIGRIAGYTPEECYADPEIHRRIVDLVDQPFLDAFLANRFPRQPTLVRWHHRDGRLVWTEHHSVPILDSSGELLAIEAIIRDVTAREEAHANLRFQAHLLDSVTQAVIATDLAGSVTYWNRRAELLYGWAQTEVIGRNLVDLIVAEETREQVAVIVADLRTGARWSGELLVHGRDGRVFPCQVSVSGVHDTAGNLVGLVGVTEDVTDRKRHQEERARLASALARLEERERIAMDLHDGLVQSLYGVSLRLGAIMRGRLADQAEQQRALGETIGEIGNAIKDAREYVQVLSSSDRHGGLRAGLATLAKQFETRETRVDYVLIAGEKAIERKLGPDAIAHLLQIAREAVSNAVRHGGASVVSIRPLWSRRRFVLLVRDDGVGFDPSRVARGHGLRNMAERARALGATLRIEAAPSQGTEVRVEVPLDDREEGV